LANWLASRSPSVLALPEWRNNEAGQKIKELLTNVGFKTVTTARATPKTNKVLLAAEDFVRSREITPPNARAGDLVLIETMQGIRILGCYFPQRRAKEPFFERCIQVAMEKPDAPFVMIGDLNTGRNDLDIEGSGAAFYCSDHFNALSRDAGLTDLWRARHGNRQEWTWRSSANGFRIDHAFGNKAFVDRFSTFRCAIDHTPRLSGLTDHSAVFLEAD
jgi:exonuclease III